MPIPQRHNREWTPHELRRMRALARRGVSARAASPLLGRSTGAVKFKAMTEGVRFRAINQARGVQRRPAQRRLLSRIASKRHAAAR